MQHSSPQTMIENDQSVPCSVIMRLGPQLCGEPAIFFIPTGPRIIKVGWAEIAGGSPFFLCRMHWADAEHPVLPMADFLQKYYEQRLRELKFE